jgi:diaminopimelate decarboxylase
VDQVGFRGGEIMFTSNNTPAEEYVKARGLGAIINLDDIGHIDFLEQHGGLPALVSFRYNPGSDGVGNRIIGNPVDSKFGVTREQLFEGYRRLQEKGVRRFGLHTMLVSNELNVSRLTGTAGMLFELAVELWDSLGIELECINLGGGIGIPYRPDEQPVDVERLAAGIRSALADTIGSQLPATPKIYMECGRYITGPHGYLVTRVRHIKESYKRYVGVDASMADLMRPGMYGAYHHITVPGKEQLPHDWIVDVTGSLCENNDKFAIDRPLPVLKAGELLVIHDAGAHGRSMGFNYNGKLRAAELLLREDGQVQLIRRAETLDDYFATLRFPGSSWPARLAGV